MEIASAEDPQSDGTLTDVGGERLESVDGAHENNEVEPKLNMSNEAIRGIMEVIAATGKFWHDWDMLKRLLSFWLRQVWTEYPESKIASVIDSQSSFPGETFAELLTRLDEALLSFIEGPPFTLQRLCEILLAPKSIYPKLSKLALALEKNLLVTSTLTKCHDPYPLQSTEKLLEHGMVNKYIEEPSYHVLGGAENLDVGDMDAEMAEADANEALAIKDTEMQEAKAGAESASGTD